LVDVLLVRVLLKDRSNNIYIKINETGLLGELVHTIMEAEMSWERLSLSKNHGVPLGSVQVQRPKNPGTTTCKSWSPNPGEPGGLTSKSRKRSMHPSSMRDTNLPFLVLFYLPLGNWVMTATVMADLPT
jgi:hypothetical protein